MKFTSKIIISLVFLLSLKANATEFKGYISATSGIATTSIHNLKIENSQNNSIKKIKDSNSSGSFVDISVGYDLLNILDTHLRLDFNYIKYFSTQSELKLENSLFMFNGFYDFVGYSDTLDRLGITPYIGLGAGWNDLNIKSVEQAVNSDINKNYSNFVYNISTGINFYLNDTFSATLGYKFINEGKQKIAQGNEKTYANIYDHQFMLGIKYHFTLR